MLWKRKRRSPSRITGELIGQALIDAGVIRKDDSVSRIVIDIRAGKPVEIHVERFGDERLLSVVPAIVACEAFPREVQL